MCYINLLITFSHFYVDVMWKVIRMCSQGKTISPTARYFECWRLACTASSARLTHSAASTLQWAQDAVVSALSAE